MSPLSMMQPCLFNYEVSFKILKMVTSPKLIPLGVGTPLHPYLREVIEMYDASSIQFSTNSYKLVIDLFILYFKFGIFSSYYTRS